MFSLAEMPWATTLFTAYASITGSIMLARTLANQLIPAELQTLLVSKLQFHFRPMSSEFTVIIQEYDGLVRNQIYDAAELLLQSRITPTVERLKVHKVAKEKHIVFGMDKGQEVIDVFRGIQLKWKYISETVRPDPVDPFAEDRSFELKFHKKHKDQVLASYLPYLLNSANTIKEEKKAVKLHATCVLHSNGNGNGPWGSVNLDHPATFDTLAMDHKLKREIIDDLDRFVRRREFYKKVGKAWKRGYLLYGPPGTGKSSLIAAMANHLKFDVYDLELRNVMSNCELKKLLVATANRSILVVEDIDCSMDLTNRETPGLGYAHKNKITLSGLLNFIDGLWSSCGDERIIIFTTNHKDRLDPALLRPGRMDKHIHLSYCTAQGFNILASNYLGIHNDDQKSELCLAIEESIEKSKATPAEVAEELMKSEESDIALAGLLEFLKRKRIEQDEPKMEEDECQEPKRLKV